jgi:hypothetical protein
MATSTDSEVTKSCGGAHWVGRCGGGSMRVELVDGRSVGGHLRHSAPLEPPGEEATEGCQIPLLHGEDALHC